MNNKAKVVEIKKNPRGEITDVVLDNGNVYSTDEARMMAADGVLEGFDLNQPDSGGEKEMPDTLDLYE